MDQHSDALLLYPLVMTLVSPSISSSFFIMQIGCHLIVYFSGVFVAGDLAAGHLEQGLGSVCLFDLLPSDIDTYICVCTYSRQIRITYCSVAMNL